MQNEPASSGAESTTATTPIHSPSCQNPPPSTQSSQRMGCREEQTAPGTMLPPTRLPTMGPLCVAAPGMSVVQCGWPTPELETASSRPARVQGEPWRGHELQLHQQAERPLGSPKLRLAVPFAKHNTHSTRLDTQPTRLASSCVQDHPGHCHLVTSHHTTPHYTTLHCTTPHCTTLHYTTPHYTTLQLHHTTLHYNYTTLHYAAITPSATPTVLVE